MNSILEELDRAINTVRHAPATRKDCFGALSLGLLGSPFLLTTFMFVPIFGQILGVLALGLTIYWLRLKRAPVLAVCWLAGVIIFGSAAMLLSYPLRQRMDLVMFFLLSCGIPVSIAYVAIVAALIWETVHNHKC